MVLTLQVKEATLPDSKPDEKSMKQSNRTRSSKRQVSVEDERSTSEEGQANGDATEDQLQVSIWECSTHHCLCCHCV